MKPASPQSAPMFESLEGRCLLSGNVTADVIRNCLVIKGDAADNQIQITVDQGQYVVTGLGDTTVNDGASATLQASGSVVLTMGDGNDEVTVQDAYIGDSVAGRTKNLFADMGAGDDAFSILGASQARNVALRSGSGANTFNVGGDTGGTSLASLDIATGSGDSVVDIKGSSIRWVNLCLGAGTNQVSIASVDGAATTLGSVSIFGMRGTNQIDIQGALGADGTAYDTTIQGTLSVMLGKGDDVVTIGSDQAGVKLGGAMLSLGAGADQVSLTNVTAARTVNVQAGAGDDTITLSNSTFNGSVRLDGGAGTDTLNDSGNTYTQPAVIRNIEVPPDVNTDPTGPGTGGHGGHGHGWGWGWGWGWGRW